MFKRFIKLTMVMLLFGTTASFAAEKFTIDPAHSNMTFTARHMLIAKVSGKFKTFSGTILYDANDLTKSSVEVEIEVQSVDTGNERRDNHLRSSEFFDAANNPLITFVSKKIEKRGDDYVAIGDLTIRGVTKAIELPFKILGTLKDKDGNIVRLGAEAKTSLNRFDYGVSWNKTLDTGGLIVGEIVDLDLTVEAVKSQE